MGAKCFGEFVGTAVLILLGDGVVANVLLKKSEGGGRRLAGDCRRAGRSPSSWAYSPPSHAAVRTRRSTPR